MHDTDNPDPDDLPTRLAGRPLVRRMLGQRQFVRMLRQTKAREIVRDWRRAQPARPPHVWPWCGPYEARPRRNRRRPVRR